MIRRRRQPCAFFLPLLCGLSLAGLPSFAADVETAPLTLPQMLQQVIRHYPSLQSAALQVEKAQQETARIESQLGWQLGAQAGVHKDVSLFGSAVNQINVGTRLARQLPSGNALSLSASISRDDADSAPLPTLPNPATSTSIDLQYRMPLAQGKDNPAYSTGLAQADAGLRIQLARQQQAYDQIAAQLIDLYSAALTTQQRIDNVRQSIRRSQQLHSFILDRVDLGIAENKDSLQTEAQLHGLQAQLKELELASAKQSIALNRLMGLPWGTAQSLRLDDAEYPPDNLPELIAQARYYSPALHINDAQMELAASRIALQRDNSREQIDMVLQLGNRGQSGDTVGGSINQNEVVGGIQLEYSRPVDSRGDDAALYQAQLERSIIAQDRKQISDDLHYDAASLLAELKAIQATIKAYRLSVKSERAKLDEAERRYRQGRITIDTVIQFENQTAASELGLVLQRIDYQRSLIRLELLRGTLWDAVNLTALDNGDARP